MAMERIYKHFNMSNPGKGVWLVIKVGGRVFGQIFM